MGATTTRALVVCVALLAVVAGCTAGGPATDTGGPATSDGTADDGTADNGTAGDGTGGGVVNFYVSDRPNDIDDFRHLNVTVDRIVFERSPEDGGGRVERDANDTTVDLTRLVGENATLVDSYDIPEGNYTKVSLYAADVEGVLTDGSDQRVKLPSGKLQLTTAFRVGPNSSVDFVFDVAVHEAGRSGKYILRPVVSESGPDVEKRVVGRDGGEGSDGRSESRNESDDRDDRENGDGSGERNDRDGDQNGGNESDGGARTIPLR